MRIENFFPCFINITIRITRTYAYAGEIIPNMLQQHHVEIEKLTNNLKDSKITFNVKYNTNATIYVKLYQLIHYINAVK